MGNFRRAFERELIIRKVILGIDGIAMQNAIEDIYTKIYEEIIEIK